MYEIRTFRLADGVDEPAFRAVDEHLQVQFAYQQPGFLRRGYLDVQGEDLEVHDRMHPVGPRHRLS